jgi:hypothetical protein
VLLTTVCRGNPTSQCTWYRFTEQSGEALLVRLSARAARMGLRFWKRFLILKYGRRNFFRAVRCAPPRKYRAAFPEPMRRGQKAPIGLGDLGFLESNISVPGGCRQRQLWSASHRRLWCTLSRLVRWVNAHSSKQSRTRAACTWSWGGDLKPCRLTAAGTFSRLWIVGFAIILQQAFGGKTRQITARKKA